MTIKAEIKAAMQKIAQRRTGKSKLVYDKATRTIVSVSANRLSVKVLDVSALDDDQENPG
ncbi:hypothetical protein LCGC14_0886620 [marine sediment metagenome]|uniref:Uncharacterized protein n=1 Tax=marine sediment metagenome TaxID=412755 RepID=A0A0F9P0H3_9ZZZZ